MDTNEEIALVKEGVAILNELGDKNEFKDLIDIIENTPKHLQGLTEDEKKQFISSFS